MAEWHRGLDGREFGELEGVVMNEKWRAAIRKLHEMMEHD